MSSIEDVPPNALLLMLSFLRSPRDVINCGLSAKCFARVYRAEQIWRPLIAQRFGLNLQAVGRGAHVDWPDIFRYIRTSPGQIPTKSVQFQGVYTDGDVDTPLSRYWVHNAFADNHWQIFCSDRAPNVHAVGLLVDELAAPWDQRPPRVAPDANVIGPNLGFPRDEASHRRTLVDRLRGPTNMTSPTALHNNVWADIDDPNQERNEGFRVIPALEQMSTWQLEMLLLHLLPSLHDNPQASALLTEASGDAIDQLAVQQLLKGANEASLARDRHVKAILRRETDKQLVLDSRILPFLRAPTDSSFKIADRVGVISRLRIVRPDLSYTCPISAGCVFLGTHRSAFRTRFAANAQLSKCTQDSASSAAAVEIAFEGFQAITEEAVCAALKGITTVEDLSRLEPMAAAGTFPRPIRGGCSDRAAWLEFDPDWQPPGGMTLRPVAWFAFATLEPSVAAGYPCGSWVDPVHNFPPQTLFTALPWDAISGTETEFEDGPIEDLYREVTKLSIRQNLNDIGTTHSHNLTSLELPLRRLHGGTCAVIKLIDFEDRIPEGDPHDHPNVDLAAVGFLGRDVVLPSSVQIM